MACPRFFAILLLLPALGCGSNEPAAEQSAPPKDLMLALTGEFPAAGARDVCADASLTLSFTSPPTLGKKGKLQVFDAAAPDAAVVTINLEATFYSAVIGGQNRQLLQPVSIDGSEVSVYLAGTPLEPDHDYFVHVNDGVFLDENEKSLGAITARDAWQFTTVSPSLATPGELRVAGDGTADFCSIQGAIDFVPAGNTERATISVSPGTYREMLVLVGKQLITLSGEDRETTIVSYPNNDDLNPGTHGRAMVNAEGSNDLVIESITLENPTPEGGSQAEALRVEPGQRVVLRNATFRSRQDTLLLSGQVYVADSLVEGNVDFIWGKGGVFFERTELKTIGRAGYEVQARNPPGQYGYVFVDSKLTADEGIAGQWLGRIDVTEYPGSQVAYIDCELGAHVNPVGWLITPNGAEAPADLRFWEYGNVDTEGLPVNRSRRASFSKELTEEEAMPLRDPSVVLSGWDPLSVP